MALIAPVQVPAAIADECIPVTLPDGVVIPCEGGGGGGDEGGGGGDNPGGGVEGPQTCEFKGEEISCSSSYGSWNGRCYERVFSDNPQDGNDWEGHDDGFLVECTPPECAQNDTPPDNCDGYAVYWRPNAPAAAGPSAEELARRAVAALNLSMGQIGSTPPASSSNQDAVGAIGLPIWLWIANPAENTTGPITSPPEVGGGLTVTATGTLDRVEWTLTAANGNTVGAISCDGANAPGTPYDGRNSAEPSPTCGFGADLNSSPGTLTLTGTAHWVVEWQSSGGQGGQILFTTPPNSTQIRIGELQALVRD
ncbi:hypothetical protein [Promicromonospora soli]